MSKFWKWATYAIYGALFLVLLESHGWAVAALAACLFVLWGHLQATANELTIVRERLGLVEHRLHNPAAFLDSE